MPAEILILTELGDSTARHVKRLLTQRGANVVLFDPGGLPAESTLTTRLSSSGTTEQRLSLGEQLVDLSSLGAVWFRRPSDPVVTTVEDPVTRRYVESQCGEFAGDVWDSLGCRLVPAADAVVRLAARKIFQLVTAGRLGFKLPSTLITTDADELLDFYCAYDGKIITKVIDQLGTYCADNDFMRFTQPVSTRDLVHINGLRQCPIIAQPYVEKALEVRVTVIGNQVFAVEIHSQESNHARHDWRRYDIRMTPHGVHQLSTETDEHCRDLVRQLGLCFGAIDLIVTPGGEYIFLEINPNGQFLWLEKATGLPMSDALCDLLLSREAV